MSDAPKTIYCKEGHDSWSAWGHWYTHNKGGGIEYTRADTHLAEVAGAFEAAAEQFTAHPWSWNKPEIQEKIRDLTYPDAQAALERRIAEAVQAEREACASIADARVGHDSRIDGATDQGEAYDLACDDIATAIRNRGKTSGYSKDIGYE